MKKQLVLLFVGINTFVLAQNTMILRQDINKKSEIGVNSTSGKIIRYDEILGSPYDDKIFREAKVAEGYKNAFVRYNSYKDEVEFQQNEEVMIVPKQDPFKSIEILSPKQKIVLLNLSGETEGYYYEITKGKYSLYKKIKINFTDVKAPTSPYGKEEPAEFSSPTITYFLVTQSKVIKKPKNNKDILQLVDSNQAVANFLKENKIKFDKEEDLKKLTEFLNQNL